MVARRTQLPNPLAWLRGWWWRRLPATPEHVLTQRNLYVLPTRAGWMLGVTLLLLLVGSINYQLNLGHLLTFLLLGSLAVSVYVGHANIRGVRLTIGSAGEAFAGQSAAVRVHLAASGRRTRWALTLRWAHPAADTAAVDIAPGDTPTLTLPLLCPKRGRQALPVLYIETRYPLGAVRIWSAWRPAGHVIVYPAPEVAAPPLPTAVPTPPRPATPARARVPVRATVHDDPPDGVRPYRSGDLPTRVLWKKAARSDDDPAGWLVRQREPAHGSAQLCLDDAACALADVEARRARLCAWVLQADALGLRYGLRLPGVEVAPDIGPAHRRRCLEALACH